ncbi:neuronal acetylcholine receptor subunit alpha-6-like isoform X1 [Macrobrachium rosenbergii]|uniref:neuronal acetylcholine receptor subunit alpha-6-like isoform X1 n=2 Tax=Macrobrachium rosenbergii TaxID=79674 RepID=UPI0034D52371
MDTLTRSLLVFSTFSSLASCESNLWDINERLRTQLLQNYQKMTFPHKGPNDTATVFFDFLLMGAWFQEDLQILNVKSWVVMMWYEPRFVWDPKDFGSIEILHLASDEIWKPDITLYNNADVKEVNHYGKNHVLVYPSGMVLWVPPALFQVECPLDFTYWPYDLQQCHLVIGSWTSHGWQIDLQLFHNNSEVQLGAYWEPSHEWQFQSGTIWRQETKYACCPEPYVSITITLNLKRVSATFTGTIVIPACAISALTLIQFLLPVREKKRLLVGCCCLLLTILEVIHLGSSIPRLSTSTPIIVKFYGQTFIVVTVSVAVTALILRLTDTEHPAASTPPPNLLKTILMGPLSSLLFLHHYTEKVGRSGGGDEDGEVLDTDIKNSVNYAPDWLLVAAAFDRLAALCFLVTFVVMLIAYVAPV